MRRSWNPAASAVAVWGGAVAASALAAIASGQAPTVIAAVIARPIILAAACLFACLAASLILRQRADSAWSDIMRMLPAALGVGVLASWLGVWNDGSGAIPLAPGQAAIFALTAGLFPMKIGPEALLRFAVLALAVLLAVSAWRTQPSRARAVLAGVAAWIGGALVLLVRSWMAVFAAAVRGLAISNPEDAMRALGAIHANSYWSNFQADRFFAGVGRQFETAVALSSSAVLVIVCVALLATLAARIQPWARRGVIRALAARLLAMESFASLLFASALAAGFASGLRGTRIAWTALDAVAVFLLAIAFISWFAFRAFGREVETLSADERSHPERPLPSGLVSVDDVRMLRGALLSVAVVSGVLLGWPVLLAFAALAAIEEIASASGRAANPWGRGATVAASAALLVLVGGLFAARTPQFPFHLGRLTIAWAAVAAAVAVLPAARDFVRAASGRKTWLPFLLVAAAGSIAGLALRLPVAFAALALLLVCLFVARSRENIWRIFAVFGLIVFGWIVTAASVMTVRM